MLTPVYYGVLYFFDSADNIIIASVEAFVLGLSLDVLALLLVCVWFYTESDYYFNNLLHKENYPEPSKIALHWRAFNDTVCIKVNFK